MKNNLALGEFKSLVRRGLGVPPKALLHKDATLVIEPAGDRRKLFTISTPAIDRDNDTIAVKGWDLGAYLKNPIVLWGHESYMPPIGRSIEVGTEGGALKAIVEFVPHDMPIVGEQAEMCFRMCELGFLSACSVGFRPVKWVVAVNRLDDGESWYPPMDFMEQELLEWSICTIPSNPEAVIDPSERAATLASIAAAAQASAEAAATKTADWQAMMRSFRLACV